MSIFLTILTLPMSLASSFLYHSYRNAIILCCATVDLSVYIEQSRIQRLGDDISLFIFLRKTNEQFSFATDRIV